MWRLAQPHQRIHHRNDFYPWMPCISLPSLTQVYLLMATAQAIIQSSMKEFGQSVSAGDAMRIESTRLQDVWAALQ